jgi:hypothetical protein
VLQEGQKVIINWIFCSFTERREGENKLDILEYYRRERM